MNLDKYSCHVRDKTNQNGSRDIIDVFFVDKGLFIFYEVGGAGGIFWTPITNYHAPPHSVLIFSHAPPPTDGHLLGVTPLSKETS